MENGVEVRMSAAVEEAISQGRNWEHSGGAVGVSKLQTLFQLYDTYHSILSTFTKSKLTVVWYMLTYFCLFLYWW